MPPLIECVPNISEGRRTEVVDRIADAVSALPGVALLDRSSDSDHNRSVFTLAGSAECLLQAVITLFDLSLAHIDLRSHTGVHPRLGAVDVVPFIPLRDCTMDDCVVLARTAARTVAERFDLPVYLYGVAASSQSRARLADIRSGQYEGLAAKIESGAWPPDFGPSRHHPSAGAGVIGARFFLIAYNVLLDTADLRPALEIARAVRESSGGLPAVQAMGVYLPSRRAAQVSLNLLDYRIASVADVYKAVRHEAARRGIGVSSSELIGLIPKAALAGATAEELLIENWHPGMILENALESAGLG